jgi:hypothetical protein
MNERWSWAQSLSGAIASCFATHQTLGCSNQTWPSSNAGECQLRGLNWNLKLTKPLIGKAQVGAGLSD